MLVNELHHFCIKPTLVLSHRELWSKFKVVQDTVPNIQWCHMRHYTDVIMTTIGSQITSLTVVYSTIYSDADQRKHQSSASLAFVWGIHWDRWIPRTKAQLRGKCFHLMTSSWHWGISTLSITGHLCRESISQYHRGPVMQKVFPCRDIITLQWRHNEHDTENASNWWRHHDGRYAGSFSIQVTFSSQIRS